MIPTNGTVATEDDDSIRTRGGADADDMMAAQLTITERPYAVCIEGVVRPGESSRQMMFKALTKYQKSRSKVPGSAWSIVLEPYTTGRPDRNEVKKYDEDEDEELKQEEGKKRSRKTPIEGGGGAETTDVEKETKVLAFFLLQTEELQKDNMMKGNPLASQIKAYPLSTTFPKYSFWLQINGKLVNKRRLEPQQTASNISPQNHTQFQLQQDDRHSGGNNTINNNSMEHGNTKHRQEEQDKASSSSSCCYSTTNASATRKEWQDTDCIVFTKWRASRHGSMASGLKPLSLLRQLAMSLKSQTCRYCDLYLTNDTDDPNVFLEFSVWTSRVAHDTFLKLDAVQKLHSFVKRVLFGGGDDDQHPHQSSNTTGSNPNPTIFYWKKMAE
jgi:hypothetical protein